MGLILLQGGTVLYHNEDGSVSALRETDILISDSVISDISPSIPVPTSSDVQIIDCKEKIVCPGFIDTHHHPWQTQMKGIHSDDTLVDYFPTGNLQSFNYRAEDVFWGELGGLVEAIGSGTTTMVDHSHVTRSPDFAFAALAATLASGIRSTYCLTLVPTIKKWDENSFELDNEPIPPWFFDTLAKLKSATNEDGGARVRLGLAFDSYGMPSSDIVSVFEQARNTGAELITSHWRRLDPHATISIPDKLHSLQLLNGDILLSHGNGSTGAELELLAKAGCYIASTPPTESQMGHGEPTFGPGAAGNATPLVSLGVDCNSNNCSSMLHAMHLYLAVARSHRNSRLLSQNKFPSDVQPTTEKVFNMATIEGARAINMAEIIGSLKAGKQADVLIFDASSPAMIPASDRDPLVAVVRHAGVAEIETVIIAGQIKKVNGALLPVAMTTPSTPSWDGEEKVRQKAQDGLLPWPVIAEQLRRSWRDIQKRAGGCNMEAAKRGVMGVLGLSERQLESAL